MKKILINLFILPMLLGGCATMKDSMLMGASMGAATGGAVGNVSSQHSAKGTAIGALVGAGLGAAFGYLGHKDKVAKERKLHLLQKTTKYPKPPRLSDPKYRSLWVPDKIEGDRYIEGHRVYIIEESGKWTK